MLRPFSFAWYEKKAIFDGLMQKAFLYSILIFTCVYFFTGGNLSLFSKLGKGVQTELCDMDEDPADPEGKEGKDCKEDGCDEEVYLEILHAATLGQRSQASLHNFRDPHLFIHTHFLEKTAPPPRA